jgi:hypothetical protein
MPAMANFDDGRHSDSKSTTFNDTKPSLSHTTSQRRTIHQETALSSSPFHPTHHLVGFLHQDNVHQKLKTPCRRHCCCPRRCRRRRCHCSFEAFQDALPLILESTPADLGTNTTPSLTRTAKAVFDLPPQAFSPTGPTHPPVQDLHRSTGLLENSNKPQHQSAAQIQHWLPFAFQNSCFFSFGGHFLSFPGFNSLIYVTLLQPVQPFTHKCSPKSENLANHHQQVDSASKTMAYVSIEAQLSQLEKTVKEMNDILCIIVLEIRQRSLAISPAPLPPTHTVVNFIHPLDTVMSLEQTGAQDAAALRNMLPFCVWSNKIDTKCLPGVCFHILHW